MRSYSSEISAGCLFTSEYLKKIGLRLARMIFYRAENYRIAHSRCLETASEVCLSISIVVKEIWSLTKVRVEHKSRVTISTLWNFSALLQLARCWQAELAQRLDNSSNDVCASLITIASVPAEPLLRRSWSLLSLQFCSVWPEICHVSVLYNNGRVEKKKWRDSLELRDLLCQFPHDIFEFEC